MCTSFTYLLCSVRCSLSIALSLPFSVVCWQISCSYSCACLSWTLSSRSWSLSTLSLPRQASSRCRCHVSTSVSKAVTWPWSTAFWAMREALWEDSVEFSTYDMLRFISSSLWVNKGHFMGNHVLFTCCLAVSVCKAVFCSCRVVVCRCSANIWLLRDVFWFSSCLSWSFNRLVSVFKEAFCRK